MRVASLLEEAFDHIGQGILLFDAEQRLVGINAPCAELLDLPVELTAPGTTHEAILRWMIERGDCGSGAQDRLLADLMAMPAAGEQIRTERRMPGGRILEVRNALLPGGGLVCGFTDVTEYRDLAAAVQRHSLFDGLTQLPNRFLFQDRINQAADRAAAGGPAFAILLVDLDRFKRINDSLGHAVGDEVLVAAAKRLRMALQPTDTVARLSGDDFGVLVSDISSRSSLLSLAEWLQQELASPFRVRGHEIYLSSSIGIALAQDTRGRGDDVLQAAGIALDRARLDAKGKRVIFNASMARHAAQTLTLESELRHAVERGEIVPYFQPIVDLQTGHIAGFESLLRWRHPERGLISPGDFIPAAEESGLILDLGRHALKASCRQMAEWVAKLGHRAPGHVSVNLSGRQLDDHTLVADIEATLRETGLDGSRLKLEVTESMILGNPEQTASILMDMKRLGVALSIDDFGTGYSSLSYLHRFPFDTIKIDKSFVTAMETRVENREIVRTITVLGHNLGMDLIAEGVERQETVQTLRSLGCEYGQGFLFARPQDAEQATALIAQGQAFDLTPAA